MQKVLNQDQIDAMFRAGKDSAPTGERVVSCNFRNAGQISSEHARAINGLHEGFARSLTHSLSAYLRVGFDCALVSVEQIAYVELLARIPDVTYVATCSLKPANALAAIQLDLTVAFPIVDVLLGGRGEPESQLRELTEIEAAVLESVVRIICGELERAWERLGTGFEFDQRQQPSQMQRLMPPNDMALALTFEVEVGEVQGNLLLIVPGAISNALLRKLSKDWAYQRPLGSDADESLRRGLLNAPFAAELGLVGVPIRVGEVMGLRPGTVLSLKHSPKRMASLLVGEERLFEAAVVQSDRLRAAHLMGVCNTEVSAS